MLGASLGISQYVERLQGELERVDPQESQAWADLIFEAWQNEKFVFVFGNGGSATTATHISEDLGKSSLRQDDLKDETKKRLKILSLTDNLGWILAPWPGEDGPRPGTVGASPWDGFPRPDELVERYASDSQRSALALGRGQRGDETHRRCRAREGDALVHPAAPAHTRLRSRVLKNRCRAGM